MKSFFGVVVCYAKEHSKAIAGGLTTAAFAFIVKRGFHIPIEYEVPAAGFVAYAIIHFSPKNIACP